MSKVRVEGGIIVGEVEIRAPRERVFRAITKPEELVRWWGAEGVYRCTSWTADLRLGGKWRCEGESARGGSFFVEGEFTQIDPPEALAYTWKSSWVEHPPSEMRWTLMETKGVTRARIEHRGLADHALAMRDYLGGLPAVLNWLQEYMERT